MEHFLWVEKYRPKTVEETILPQELKATFQQFIDQKNIPNLILSGSAGVGSGGMVTKIEAARIATSAGTPMLLTSLAESAEALAGNDVGTIFHAQGSRTNSRLLWLAHASTPRGRLVLDDGAVTAILERGVSLLPAGVTAVEGSFISGDTVELASKDGRVIARGLVAFDAEEIPKMLGRSTKELAASLGAEYERELVHRDDLVLL
jgi:glutamate 5-kinase